MNPAGQVDQVRHTEKVYQTQGVSKTIRADKADTTKKVQGAAGKESSQGTAGTSRNMLTQLVEELEKGQVKLDKLIEMGSKGKEFSNTELLALQAGMYKYSQELDLTSKVVEKATNGLKDTLKTQV